uniref:Uncharacterized protein n=1 Tax=viral metagenome TaxID=1070528 RepID=A0A6C0JVB5_9ZZZZ
MSSFRYFLISFPTDTNPLITNVYRDDVINATYSSIYVDAEGNRSVMEDRLGPDLLKLLEEATDRTIDFPRTFYLIQCNPEDLKHKQFCTPDTSSAELDSNSEGIIVYAAQDSQKCTEFHESVCAGFFEDLNLLICKRDGWLNGVRVPSVRFLVLTNLEASDLPTIASCDRLIYLEITKRVNRDIVKSDTYIDVEINTLRCDYVDLILLSKVLNLDRVSRIQLTSRDEANIRTEIKEAYELISTIPMLQLSAGLLNLFAVCVRDFSHPCIEVEFRAAQERKDKEILERHKDLITSISFSPLCDTAAKHLSIEENVQVFDTSVSNHGVLSLNPLVTRVHLYTKGEIKKVHANCSRGGIIIDFDPPNKAKSARKVVEIE